jgi:hypothetical protein
MIPAFDAPVLEKIAKILGNVMTTTELGGLLILHFAPSWPS